MREIRLFLCILLILDIFFLPVDTCAENKLPISFIDESILSLTSVSIDFSLEDYSWHFTNEGPFAETLPLGLRILESIIPKGLCFGMCLTAGLAYLKNIPLPKCKDPFLLPKVWQDAIFDAQYQWINFYKGVTFLIPQEITSITLSPERIISILASSLRTGVPCILFIRLGEKDKGKDKASHTLLAYGIEVNGENGKIKLYDPDFPLEENYIEFKRDINTGRVKELKADGKIFNIWKVEEIIDIPQGGGYECDVDNGGVDILEINMTQLDDGVKLTFKVKNNSKFTKWVQAVLDYEFKGKIYQDVSMGFDDIILPAGEVRMFSYIFKIPTVKEIILKVKNNYSKETINKYLINLSTKDVSKVED